MWSLAGWEGAGKIVGYGVPLPPTGLGVRPSTVPPGCLNCRDKPSKPFRCLDPQYRRELVRVYLTNVEGICRRFCDDKKARLNWVREEEGAFRHFWGSLTPEQQRKYLTDKGEVILKVGGAQGPGVGSRRSADWAKHVGAARGGHGRLASGGNQSLASAKPNQCLRVLVPDRRW